MDLQSIMGYANNSPFRNAPYLDIQTPEGLITMENTPVDLLGVDNLGNVKKMKAGRKKNYSFPGTQVREIPLQSGGAVFAGIRGAMDSKEIAYQAWRKNLPASLQYEGDYDLRQLFVDSGAIKPINGHFPDTYKLPNHPTFSNESIYSTKQNPGGHWNGDKYVPAKSNNPYQMGGMTQKQLFDFIFDDEDTPAQAPTAPTTAEIEPEQQDIEDQRRRLADEQNDAMAMEQIMSVQGNPYQRQPQAHTPISGNPYTGEIVSEGKFGNQNVGPYGKQIYGQLATDLGYAPTVNSVYRSKAYNDSLIAAGKPASRNSWHLTGNAIDLKPTDWHRLSNEQQQYYRMNYDVIYHDNHYHIEPK